MARRPTSRELEDGTAELGFAQSDVMAYAYDGTNLFEGKPVTTFSTLGALYQEQVQIVTCDPNITSPLPTSRASASPLALPVPASTSTPSTSSVPHGLSESDINPTYQSFGDSADALKEGRQDRRCLHRRRRSPTTAITDLSTTKQALPDLARPGSHPAADRREQLLPEAVIPAGTYSGQGIPMW